MDVVIGGRQDVVDRGRRRRNSPDNVVNNNKKRKNFDGPDFAGQGQQPARLISIPGRWSEWKSRRSQSQSQSKSKSQKAIEKEYKPSSWLRKWLLCYSSLLLLTASFTEVYSSQVCVTVTPTAISTVALRGRWYRVNKLPNCDRYFQL